MSNYEYDNLMSLTNDGLKIANFTEIRDALIKRFREIYGKDIYISDKSADGIFIYTVSLMINNLLQSISTMYSNLNLSSASGKFLDNLCSLSNIYRKEETYSTCKILILNNEQNDITPRELIFEDGNGNNWSWVNKDNISFKSKKDTPIVVTCLTPGPINLLKGTLKTIDNSYNITITQDKECEVGNYKESDIELRERKIENSIYNSPSILNSLYTHLRELEGVRDCYINVNDSGSEIPLSDGVRLLSHDIFIDLDISNNVDIQNKDIAEVIYRYLTPGIRCFTPSTSSSDSSGDIISYDYVIQYINQKMTMKWKKIIYVEGNSESNYVSVKLYLKDKASIKSTVDMVTEKVTSYINNLEIKDIKELSVNYSDLDIINTITTSSNYYVREITNFKELLGKAKLTRIHFKGEHTEATEDTSNSNVYTFKVY